MKFDYELTGIGWAEVNIEIQDKIYFSSPSYLSEPLVDLLEGLLSIIPGCVPDDELKTKNTFKWFQEPAVDKWTLELKKDFNLKILIESFEDEFTCNGKLEFDVTCNLLDFLNEFIKSIEQLLIKHGIVGYKNTWYGQEFPISSYLRLKYYLNSKTAYPTQKDLEMGLYKSSLKQDIDSILDLLK